MDGRDRVTRGRLVQLSGIAAGVALAGCSDGGPGGEGGGADRPASPTGDAGTESGGTETAGTGTGTAGGEARRIRHGARTSGWVGREPESIAGQTNPTLPLAPGTTYRLAWENLDGADHELIIRDGNGEEVAASDSSAETGAIVRMEFEATEEMAGYICEYHPQQMRGEVRATAGTETAGTATGADGGGGNE